MSAVAEAPQPADTALQAVLTNLVHDGAKICADLAAEDSPAGPKAEPYERITRAVRRTIILARHIAEHPIKPAENPADAAAAKLTLGRRRIARDIEEDIDYAERQGRTIDSLRDELHERLEDPDLDLEILHGSIGDILDKIRRDFGLANSRYSKPLPRRAPSPPPVRTDPVSDPPLDPDVDDDEIEPATEPDDDEEPHPLLAAIRKLSPIRDG